MKKIIILVGPSGSGKSTLEAMLVKELGCSKIVSHTSRAPRAGEIDGVDYHYVDKDYFNNNLEDFLEVVNFGDNFYGVHKDSLPDGLSVLVAEPNGAVQISEYSKKHREVSTLMIYLDVSKETQVKRMLSRGDSEEMVSKRMEIDNISDNVHMVQFNIEFNTEIISQKDIVNGIKEALNAG